jgi:hypothetical protein
VPSAALLVPVVSRYCYQFFVSRYILEIADVLINERLSAVRGWKHHKVVPSPQLKGASIRFIFIVTMFLSEIISVTSVKFLDDWNLNIF